MNVLQSNGLKQRAASILREKRPEFRKVVTMHAAVSFGVVLLVSLLQLLLTVPAGSKSGLDGFGITAAFSTAKATLGLISGILMPFWELGVLYTAIRATRGQETEFTHLTRGFHRWGVVLRYYLLLIVLYFVMAMILSNVIPVVMWFIPMPQALESAMMDVVSQNITDPMEILQAIPKDMLMAYILPISAVFMAVFAGAILYFYYRFRLSQYLLMDDPAMPALPSLIVSNHMTKGHKWSLCKLDLSFWWYYVLQLAVAALSFGPEILAMAGVTLPVSSDVAFFLFQVLYCIAGVAIAWFFGAYVQTTYACAYDELRNPPQDQTVITV